MAWQLRLASLGCAEPVSMTLTWSSADPFAVGLEFPGAGVHWVVARELLAAGLTGPAGLGDVALLPDLNDPDRLELILSSPEGLVGLRMPAGTLAAFLRATWQRVPAGSEADPEPDLAGDGPLAAP